ncbi:MAG TPA: tetratricopeptide repeat protein [Alphaproteobacteria bacterium]|nr:tetratricopeptide repeat protein [Alphaproteobacteria bacterium]
MKTQTSLIALISMMVILGQPAWSMEEKVPMDVCADAGRGTKRPLEIKPSATNSEDSASTLKRARTSKEGEKEGENEELPLTLMDMPPEIQDHIFASLASQNKFKAITAMKGLIFVNKSIHEKVTHPSFLMRFIPDAYLERDTIKNTRGKAFALFYVLTKAGALISRDAKGTAEALYWKALQDTSPIRQSRLIVFRLTSNMNHSINIFNPALAGRMHSTIFSLWDEIDENPTDTQKSQAFWHLYLAEQSILTPPITHHCANLHLTKVVKAELDGHEEGMTIPPYLLRLVAQASQCAYTNLPFNSAQQAQLLKAAADRDDAEAQYQLGRHYSGDGSLNMYQNPTHPDTVKAIGWYKRAASQGHVNATFEIGFYYHLNGYEGDKEKAAENLNEAIHWFTKAAALGHTEAQGRLGWIYCLDKGKPELGIPLLRRAVANGFDDSEGVLAKFNE